MATLTIPQTRSFVRHREDDVRRTLNVTRQMYFRAYLGGALWSAKPFDGARPVLFRAIGTLIARPWPRWAVDLVEAVSEPVSLDGDGGKGLAEALTVAMKSDLGCNVTPVVPSLIEPTPRAVDMDAYCWSPKRLVPIASGRSRLPAERGSSPGPMIVVRHEGLGLMPRPRGLGDPPGDGRNKAGATGRRTAYSGEKSAGRSLTYVQGILL